MSAPRQMPATLPLTGLLLLLCATVLAGPPLEGIAERMTREAIDAGIAGEEELRATTLAKVHQLAPDYAPARWESGQIKVDGEWLAVSQAQSQSQSDSRLQEYLVLRESASDEPLAQQNVARWCDEQGLADEADYHWRRVLGVDPQNAEALGRLGVVWFQGQLHPRSELASLETRQREQTRSLKEWNAKIDAWMRKMAGGEIRQQQIVDQMRDELDESAISAFEQMAGTSRGWNTSQGKRRIAVSIAFLQVMADRETFEGTQTLVRHALLAQSEEIRQAAIHHLPSRPQDETVPLLLSCLSAPLESRFDIRVTPSGRAVYTHQIFAEGPDRDEVREVSREGIVGQDLPSPDNPDAGDTIEGRIRSQRTRANFVNNFARSAQALEQQIARENATRQAVNSRVIEALKLVTSKDLGDSPNDWWKDWYATNGYEVDSYRPLDVTRDTDSQYVYLPPPRENLEWVDTPNATSDTPSRPPTGPRPTRPEGGWRNPASGMLRATGDGRWRHECFVAGTPVWTKTGQKAIETVKAGDQVLCQDLASGELLFRPVLDTTLRQPSPMIHIATADEVITATEGHPFWIPGKGWLMARELSPGDRLLTVNGLVEIEGVTAAPNDEAYNLVVADHANYFVGSKGMLVHDNTPRRPNEVAQAVR